MTQFSLVLATLERTAEVERLLSSVEVPDGDAVRIIVVDQNPDDRLVPILRRHEGRLELVHLRAGARGVSHARNRGIDRAGGDVVAFPDDDCWYPPGLLKSVAGFFAEHPGYDGFTVRPVDETGRPCAARSDNRAGEVTRLSAWRRGGGTVSIFVRAPVAAEVGFDETLGPGADGPWGSGEDTDFLLRALGKGFRIYYDPAVQVGHPEPVRTYDRAAVDRAYRYGMGMGRIIRKHGFPLWFAAYHCLRPLAGSVLSLLCGRPGKARYHWGAFRGRVRGWLGWA
jgi:glycosyltransferase involved in cell wall biosynthesis